MTDYRLEGLTLLIDRWSNGERRALDQLVALVYAELRRTGHRLMQRERPGHMLETSALVHETYLRLLDLGKIHWQDRGHFFIVTAGVMRRILVDQARTHGALKRGGDRHRVTLDENELGERVAQTDVNLLSLDMALERLSERDPVQARVVELRYFTGITVEETAATLKISPASVKRKWTLARSWLYRELYPAPA